MIVAGPDGFAKNAYRKFNIRSDGLTPGDDYAMMREVLTRRFARLIEAESDEAEREDRRVAGERPDLVLIDGGPGQLSAALAVFAELGVNDVALAAIAKGADRNAGRERVYLPGRGPMLLGRRSAAYYYLQRLRDEAHRFAIGTHRARRAKGLGRSRLDEVPGIGPKRKRALLTRFGSVRGIEQAALTDLETVEGISKVVAKRVYDFFHPHA
jgi:excinuclease ABC subunit C